MRIMCREAAAENIEDLIAQFNAFQADKLGRAKYPVIDPPSPPVPTEPTRTKPREPNSLPSNETDQQNDAQPTNESGLLQLNPVESPIPNTPARPPIRVSSITKPRSEVVIMRHVTDGEFCERRAMEFKQFSVPPRFPLRVSHITGSEGAKCDILSFATVDARDAFLANQPGDLDSVVRFIEVKGRSDRAASIELRENELSAAEEFGDLYYIYRLAGLEDGTFFLTILQNPLKHKEALRPAVHVTLENTASTKLCSITGGLLKDDNP